MKFLDNFFNKQLIKAKSKGLGRMTSLFNSTLGKRSRTDDGFYSMIPKLILVLFIGIIVFELIKNLVRFLPYVFGVLVVLIVVLRKQLQNYVVKKLNLRSDTIQINEHGEKPKKESNPE